MNSISVLIKESLTPSNLENLLGLNLETCKTETWGNFKDSHLEANQVLVYTSISGNTYIEISPTDYSPLLDTNHTLDGKEAVMMMLDSDANQYAFVYYEKNEVSLDYYTQNDSWVHIGTKDIGLENTKEIQNEYEFIIDEYLGSMNDQTSVKVYTSIPKDTSESTSTIEQFYWKKCDDLLTSDQIIENIIFYNMEKVAKERSSGYVGFIALAVLGGLITDENDINKLIEKHSKYATVQSDIDAMSEKALLNLGEEYSERVNSLSRSEAFKYSILSQNVMQVAVKSLKKMTSDYEKRAPWRIIATIIAVFLTLFKVIKLLEN